MLDGLSPLIVFLLLSGVILVCLFEFINGFHDTANAVATVIYTNSMKPSYAVVYSGILNFLGVNAGGIAVAMTIMNLLPLEIVIGPDISRNMCLVYAILLSAILWNFGTWYLGIPASSSHTIIGSIVGSGLGFYFIGKEYGLSIVNWDKAKDAGLSLLLSPLLGFALAILLMFIFKRWIKNETIYKEPAPGVKPPLWIRMILWTTCGLVSFSHGHNDGQKGVGILMLVLIIILPFHFSIDHKINLQSIQGSIESIYRIIHSTNTSDFGKDEWFHLQNIYKHYLHFQSQTKNKFYATEIVPESRFSLRKDIHQIVKSAEKILRSENLAITRKNRMLVEKEIKEAKKLIEFAPTWIILLISLCLGAGTMIGWKRIVVTIGEKIGKQHMSYAQGASAELVASLGIGMASWLGLPVSTTHMLSSGVAGAMVAKKGIKNLQKQTVNRIALAWILTLPATIILSCGFFLLFRYIFQ